MKILLTGHTQGIGKEITNQADVIGCSRSNGYDILNSSSRKEILSKDFDVLINNAFDGMGQTLLLLDFFHRFQDTSKTIINIGSRVAEVELSDDYQHLLEYQVYKKSLKTTCSDLKKFKKNINIKYIWFGYVGTDKILAKYPYLKNYITVEDAAKQILGMINE